MSLINYKALLLLQQSSSLNKKIKNIRKFGKKRGSIGNPKLELFRSPPLFLCRGIYRRFKTYISVQLSHENALPALSIRLRKRDYSHVFMAKVWPLATLLPRKHGYSRVSAAVWIELATHFRGRIVLGLYILNLL